MGKRDSSYREKYPYLSRESSFERDEESYSFSDSSYGTSDSARPILHPPIPRKRPVLRPYRFPHTVMRCVCLGVFCALLLFVFALFRVTLIHTFIKPIEIKLPEGELLPRPPQWERFPFLKRYYGGIKTLVPRQNNVPEYPGEEVDEKVKSGKGLPTEDKKKRDSQLSSFIFDPYPNYTSPEYIARYGSKKDCFLDTAGKVSVPYVRHYNGVPKGFPDAIIGSNELLGIKDDICFDRFGRLGPYGLGYGSRSGGSGAGLEGDRSGIESVWEDVPPVDFRGIQWAEVQDRCVSANRHRFPKPSKPRVDSFRTLPLAKRPEGDQKGTETVPANVTIGTDRLPRVAFIIRTWHDFKYNKESIMYLRSLISELSLVSGGEYMVHFLIHVRDDNLQIWADDETYNRVLENALPKEFWGMGSLWSERQMGLIYGGLEDAFVRGLPVHGVYRSAFMPLQYFAHQHPDYDFYWNWEMDIRYTGHWYHLLHKISEWSKQQPRKGLWERNSRFYVPNVHGSWEDFRQMVRVQTEIGTNNPHNMWSALRKDQKKGYRPSELQPDKPIWGPERPPAEQDILEVGGEGIPPTTYEKDKYEWGVGEDADLIVLNPLYDPEGTTWLLKDDVTGYNRSHEYPPRRTSIITASRLSRKLLHTMHRETTIKRHTMFSEMWPATTCLHHGFKAVYAPHAVYIDRRWPPVYLESIFNGGRNGASGGSRMSVFGDREHNFQGTTWFYSAGHALNLWNRWLGYKVNNDGGEDFELANEGRMCLPPMLFHPIKEVSLTIDSS
ncbi:hypothetical protein D8B26_006672 [Coccidioides posadasii str. Silveira]|uniref:DUF3405 domain-containing protein n=1 Tax=Coccidioides posadasii RMSCC 3488 TaxID=454284 RepID=A0A0J6FGL2_COCPO|nr:hypothetical protein CPAG_04366 [Coccidioides posadasii RMSCC 3488]QVM12036.1 hypothetical protein D8B26_006672 [Coccidioides posadasii str. Silveira]